MNITTRSAFWNSIVQVRRFILFSIMISFASALSHAQVFGLSYKDIDRSLKPINDQLDQLKERARALDERVKTLAEEDARLQRTISDKDATLRAELTGSGITTKTDVHQLELAVTTLKADVTTLKDALKRVEPATPNAAREPTSSNELIRPPDLRPIEDSLKKLFGEIKRIDDDLAKFRTAQTPGGTQTVTAGGDTVATETSPWIKDLQALKREQSVSLSIVWTLMTGFLVMFMQAGFALVETGLTRKKNAAHTMAMNFMVYSLAMLSYWMFGFAFQMGGLGVGRDLAKETHSLGPAIFQKLNTELGFHWGGHFFGLLGGAGFFLAPGMLEGGILSLFLFQMLFMDTSATIPTGAMAERWRFLPFCLYAVAMGCLIYPVYANWVWGGGWLSALGGIFHLGHGVVDFAGSSVVHLCGGTVAFVGAKLLGRRKPATNPDGTLEPLNPHNVPFGVVGTFILAFGWFGFNAGSTLTGSDAQIGVIASNTMLASAAGAVAAMIVIWRRYGRPDPTFMCNGMLGGLVSITAPCAFVDPWAAVLIGTCAGVLVPFATIDFVDARCKIDDPVGAVSVHGVCGIWGMIALGLFANGRYGKGWNGQEGYVTGFIHGDIGQLMAQAIGCIVCITVIGTLSFVLFSVIKALVGFRSAEGDEKQGLDRAELGVKAYSD